MIPTRTLEILEGVAKDAGFRPPITTVLPRVTLWASPMPTQPRPAMFDPKFYILLQGRKRLSIGGELRDFGVGQCAVSSVSLPFTSQVIEASQRKPYLGLELRPDPAVVAELLVELGDTYTAEPASFAAESAAEDIIDTVDRIVRLLADPVDLQVLARQAERELYYRVLKSPMGGTLRQIVGTNSRFAQIRVAIEWIRENACASMRVEDLASRVGMSVTSFHRHFRAITAYSPLAYQRHIRLIDAQRLIASGGASITRTAHASGYASSSQFCREYKQMFGMPPSHAKRIVTSRP